jgi:hypothetical protein
MSYIPKMFGAHLRETSRLPFLAINVNNRLNKAGLLCSRLAGSASVASIYPVTNRSRIRYRVGSMLDELGDVSEWITVIVAVTFVVCVLVMARWLR